MKSLTGTDLDALAVRLAPEGALEVHPRAAPVTIEVGE